MKCYILIALRSNHFLPDFLRKMPHYEGHEQYGFQNNRQNFSLQPCPIFLDIELLHCFNGKTIQCKDKKQIHKIRHGHLRKYRIVQIMKKIGDRNCRKNAQCRGQCQSGVALGIQNRSLRCTDELHNQDLGNQTFYKPSGLEVVLYGKAVIAQKEPKHQEGHHVEYGGHAAHHVHKGHKGCTVPLMGLLQEFFVHIVPGNRNLRKVIDEILNQNL